MTSLREESACDQEPRLIALPALEIAFGDLKNKAIAIDCEIQRLAVSLHSLMTQTEIVLDNLKRHASRHDHH